MVGFQSLVFTLLLASWAVAIPTHPGRLSIPPYNWKTELCRLSPRFFGALCPRQSNTNAATTVSTPIGTARGTTDDAGATRFAVRYASAARWKQAVPATTWELP